MTEPSGSDSHTTQLQDLSSVTPTEAEFKILNGDDGCLDHYANAHCAITLKSLFKKNLRLGWAEKEVEGRAKMVPCIRDMDGNIVVTEMQSRQYPGQANMMKLILHFGRLTIWGGTPGDIRKSKARLNDELIDNVPLDSSARQEFALSGANSSDGPGSEETNLQSYNELVRWSTYDLATALINSKHPDFSHFTGSVENLVANIKSRHYNQVYWMMRDPRIVKGENGDETKVQEHPIRSNLFRSCKQSSDNLDPMKYARHEFGRYSPEDQASVMSVLKEHGGRMKFTPINVILPDGSRGSMKDLRTGAICAVVLGIGNLNTSGRGGAVIVRKGYDIIVYRNGPERSDDNTKLFDASSFVKDAMEKAKRGRDEDPIKGNGKPEKPTKLPRLNDVKNRLAARKKAKKGKSAEVVDSDDE